MKKLFIGLLALGSIAAFAEEKYCGKVTRTELAGISTSNDTTYAHVTLDGRLTITGVMNNVTYDYLKEMTDLQSFTCISSGNKPGDTLISVVND